MHSQDVIERLSSSHDFLALTRQYPDFLPEAQFVISPNGHDINVVVTDTGIISFDPVTKHVDNQSAKDIVLSCAVHGNETAPIEICDALIKSLFKGELDLSHRTLFLFGNPDAINNGTRFIEENMNRLFMGAHSKAPGLVNKERKRAKQLEDVVTQFFEQGSNNHNIHYDLHTAIRGSYHQKFAVYPLLHGDKTWQKSQFEFLLACGIDTVLLSESTTTTFSYFSSTTFDADAFTIELGKVKPFGENKQSDFEQAHNTLARLISGADMQLKPYDASQFNIFTIHQTINRHHEAFSLSFDDDVKNFTPFAKGDLLATDGDVKHVAQQDGEAIIFPNANVAIGQRALLTVVKTDIEPV
ncbi:succinylglutamate desuccinylase [Thalassotalea agarivorans]|uniref:Succinylglutamate desuccinylase n=1 Tax=Thalassotalea agarivorans TaxID=349064 RepID=A0A1I0FGF1_THASX|nr:succinylglutamate desuccinylase [Thalassotalea agarivorans]SET57300.1 succinylglutamate desuccinylase [Thalassotalea agarivorans]